MRASLLWACLIITAVAADAGRIRSLYVELEVTGDCAARVREVRDAAVAPLVYTAVHGPVVPATLPYEPRDFGMHAASSEHGDKIWAVSYAAPDGAVMARAYLDPRIAVLEGRYGAPPPEVLPPVPAGPVRPSNGSVFPDYAEPLQHALFETGLLSTYVPLGTRAVSVHCHGLGTKPLRLALPRQGRGVRQQQADNIKVFNHQSTGPVDTQYNIVFLAGGFTAGEEAAFNASVQRISDNMDPTKNGDVDGLHNMHHSVPFTRYWPFFNVFGVFEPSPQAGASRPKYGQFVNDNLGCFHPETLERAVQCNEGKVLALADVSPANLKSNPDNTAVIVIVNTRIYGGSARYMKGHRHIAHFYAGVDTDGTYDKLKFASLVNHELGHSIGNLMDEYDFGTSEPRTRPFLNCQAGIAGGAPVGTNVQWHHWVAIMADAPTAASYRGSLRVATSPSTGRSQWSVSPRPVSTCGFRNYYKPNEFCMMASVRDYFMCPVCREESTLTLRNDANFNLSWPRYPTVDSTLLVPQSAPTDVQSVTTGVVLHLPRYLGRSSGDNRFTVAWRGPDGQNLATYLVGTTDCPQCLFLPKAYWDAKVPSVYPVNTTVKITAAITDTTNFISAAKRSSAPFLEQETYFLIRVVAAIDTSHPHVTQEPAVLTSGSRGDYGVFPAADNKATVQDCGPTATNPNPVCRPTYTRKTYQAPEDLGGTLAKYDQWVLFLMGGLGLLFLLLWVWAALYYQKQSGRVVRPIFKTDFTGIVSFIRRIMITSSIFFMIASIAAMALSAYVYTQTSSLGKIILAPGAVLAVGLYLLAFVGFWAVSHRSKRLTLINGGLLYASLTVLFLLSVLVYSLGKDIGTRNSFWNRKLEDFWTGLVADDAPRACAIEGLLECSGFYRACNVVAGSSLYCPANCEVSNQQYGTACQRKIEVWVNDKYTMLIAALGTCVGLMLFAIVFNFTYYIKLAQMKRAIIKRNNRSVHQHTARSGSSHQAVRQCKALLILKTLDEGDMGHLMKEFTRIDADGNGELDRGEFVTFFKKALCYKPRAGEIDEIFAVADLDGNGTVSLSEFLCLFRSEAEVRVMLDAAAESAAAREERGGMMDRVPGLGGRRRSSKSTKEQRLRSADSFSPQRAREIRERAATTFQGMGIVEEELSTRPPQRPGSPRREMDSVGQGSPPQSPRSPRASIPGAPALPAMEQGREPPKEPRAKKPRAKKPREKKEDPASLL